MRYRSRSVVLGLIYAVLLTAMAGSHGIAAPAQVCLSAQVDAFLKIDEIVGESQAVSVADRCDADASIAISVNPATERATRPAEFVISVVGQKPGSG